MAYLTHDEVLLQDTDVDGATSNRRHQYEADYKAVHTEGNGHLSTSLSTGHLRVHARCKYSYSRKMFDETMKAFLK